MDTTTAPSRDRDIDDPLLNSNTLNIIKMSILEPIRVGLYNLTTCSVKLYGFLLTIPHIHSHTNGFMGHPNFAQHNIM